ncbi:MAG: hypothetical protein HOP30_01855 [Cyclobacteriaceae bacterium]|nr:hypothetical protein [Cyclobacteriaceae bacterium]
MSIRPANKKWRIAYVADSLPPIIKTSSNRNFAFLKELAKEYSLHVFTLADAETLKQSIHSSSTDDLVIHTIPQSPNGWSRISWIKYLVRFTGLDHVNAAYLHRMSSEFEQLKFDLLIVTAGPFNRLWVGEVISQRFKLPWCVDYRDEWTSEGSVRVKSGGTFVTRFLDLFTHSEKSVELILTSTISAFSSVHPQSVKHIGSWIHKKGFVIENGYFKNTFIANNYNLPTNQSIRLAYWGYVHYSQNLPEHLDTLVTVASQHQLAVSIDFYGCLPQAFQALQKATEKSEYVTCNLIKPVSIDQLFAEVILYDALIHSEYQEYPHIPSSKLYDYIATGLPVVLFNNLGGYISEVLKKTNQRIDFDSFEFVQFLSSSEFRIQFRKNIKDDERLKYSREEQMVNVHQMIQFALKTQQQS